jgi:hypothetical protein
MSNDTKPTVLKDPEDQRECPSFVGIIIGESDRGKVKLRTLSTLGAEQLLWISREDIVASSDFDDGITKLDVRAGAEIVVETLTRIKVGDPSVPNPAGVARTASSLPSAVAGFRCGPTTYEQPPMFVMANPPGEGVPACGNCDWRIVTHCTSCSDQNSSQRCARPFFPYP